MVCLDFTPDYFSNNKEIKVACYEYHNASFAGGTFDQSHLETSSSISEL